MIDSFIALEEAKIKNVQSVAEYRVLLVKLEKKADFETDSQSPETQAPVPPFDSGEVEE